MIAVIFEFTPQTGKAEQYFTLAEQLKEQVINQPGFISIERYHSVHHEGSYLSLSFWEDEASVLRWRETADHQSAQQAGKQSIFLHYRITVAGHIRQYGSKQLAAKL